MKFKIELNEMTGEVEFSGSYGQAELSGLSLSKLDRRIIKDAECSPFDSLMALALIYRRAAEQAEVGKDGAL